MLERILQPVVVFMNRLSYKKKLSVFFVIMSLPMMVYTIFSFLEVLDQKKIMQTKIEGLEYNQVFSKLLLNFPKHRGSLNGYLNGSKLFKDNILEIEKEIDSNLHTLKEIDKQNWNLYKNSNIFNIVDQMWQSLKLENITKSTDSGLIYDKHTKLIKILLSEMVRISKIIGIEETQNVTLHDLELYIYDKLPYLAEYVGQARGLGVGILSKKSKTLKESKESVFLYGAIKSTIDSMKNINKGLVRLTNDYLTTINNSIINQKNLSLDPKSFFLQGSMVINEIFDLHDKLIQQYKKDIYQKVSNLEKNIFQFAMMSVFLSLLLLYLFAAFYKSIMNGLQDLQDLSIKLSKGEMDSTICCQTNDELADVYRAFELMHHEIKANTSFLNSYKLAIDSSSIVSMTTPQGMITYVNETFCKLSGYSKEELLGKPHNIVRHPDMPKDTFYNMWQTIKSKKIWKGIVKNRAKDGSSYFVNATIIPILDENGEIVEFIAVRHDVTELENKKEELKKQRIDLLTNLYNRNQMLLDIQKMRNPVLMLVNINSFGELNDFYGSKIGDEVLVNIADLFLKIAKQAGVSVYKLHADEFAFLHDSKNSIKENYKVFILKVINFIESNKIKCSDNEITVTITASIAFSDNKRGLDLLIEDANIALRNAKSSNKKYLIYNHAMREKNNYVKNMQCVGVIREAILNDRIVVYFQPIIDNKSSKISKYESLVRLIKDDGSVVSPFFFLEIAKKAKLYNTITQIVIKKSFEAFRDLDYEFSINLTPEDIQDIHTVSFIKKTLSNFRNPKRVIFEIVESEEISDYTVVENFIKDVKSYGCQIAIDDFGSGYSNFEHILSLDIDYLKIDGSLIKDIHKDKNAKVITSAIIAFSKKLNRKTVVEFVHNKEIHSIVKELGADYSQGFYLAEPIPVEKLMKPKYKTLELLSL